MKKDFDIDIKKGYICKSTFEDSMPYEILSMQYFLELLKVEDYSLGEKFIAFAENVHRYRFKFTEYHDLLDMARFNTSYIYLEYINISNLLNVNIENILSYGRVVTDFLVRVLGVDLVGANNEKIILTSNDHLNEDENEFLNEGYTCYKLRKAIYTPHEYNAFGNYSFSDATPYVFEKYDYYLEKDKNEYEKVLCKK